MIKDSYSQLKRDEGEVLYVYDDATGKPIVKGSVVKGYPTVGIGILLDKDKGGGLRPEESEFIFRNRLKLLDAELTDRLPWISKLDPARKGVLINMAFQMGVAGLLGFKNTLAMIEAGRYQDAAKAMLQSKWATQTPARAQRLSNQMATGQWQ
jgi:lysozyme